MKILQAKGSLALFVLLVTYAACVLVVHTRTREDGNPGLTTIRIGHWQLESGFREGIDYAAREYQKIHPHVHIVQEAIPESTWKQWVSTQLMGGTASDILEIGNMEPNLVTSFYVRYFLPISQAVGRPNPYNSGTDLEKVPLVNTFKDGLRSSYVGETQEFMNIPLSLIGVRIFYNRTLLEKLTGRSTPPSNYREFLKTCALIRSQTIPSGPGKGDPYIPIAGSAWHYGRWRESMFEPITSMAMVDNDLNRDGRLSKEEMYLGFQLGRLSMKHPAYQAMLGLIHEVTAYFQTGYTGLSRDEALFLFAQERAVFIPTGSYEVMSLKTQAEGKFEIGVANFPYPDKSDPEFGSVIEGPRYELVDGQAQFGITRGSKHADTALDFLLFMASRKQNEKINARFGWIPIIKGAESTPELQAFNPNLNGVIAAFDPSLGPETAIRWLQMIALYQVNQISSEELSNQYGDFYQKAGAADLQEFLRNARRGYARDVQMLVGQRALAGSQPQDSRDWIRYRKILTDRLIGAEVYLRKIQALSGKDAEHPPIYPYRYQPEALEKIRSQFYKAPKGGNS
ncbi:MAG: extracellular solute-binding protein [Candidatus Methylacidiphilales bacterium]|nr:extracellular solute-binding protein [Candidatus Methylacidiphilales bacterium]